MIEEFAELIEEIQKCNGRKEKEEVLSRYKNNENIKYILQFIFDPYILSGISEKKLNKKLSNNSHYDCKDIISLLDYLKDHNTGKDVDIAYAQGYLNNNSKHSQLIKDIITKSLKLGVQTLTLNKIFGEGFIRSFNVQLAERYFENPEKLLPKGEKFILSTKLDGIRCCCIVDKDNKAEFFTRQGQPIEGMNELKEEAERIFPPNHVIDGELLLKNDNNLESKDLYRATVKVVNSDNEKKNIYFNCFDFIKLEDFQKGYSSTPCCVRKRNLKYFLDKNKTQYFTNVDNLYEGDDQTQIIKWLDKITSKGGEGVMINKYDSPYECKRTKNLLKVKKFNSADVHVVGMEEGTGVNKGKLGAVEVEFLGPDNKIYKCKVGSGFEKNEREDFWNNPEKILNKIIEIKYFEVTNNQQNNNYSLRFPTFESVRFDKNEISMY